VIKVKFKKHRGWEIGALDDGDDLDIFVPASSKRIITARVNADVEVQWCVRGGADH